MDVERRTNTEWGVARRKDTRRRNDERDNAGTSSARDEREINGGGWQEGGGGDKKGPFGETVPRKCWGDAGAKGRASGQEVGDQERRRCGKAISGVTWILWCRKWRPTGPWGIVIRRAA